MSYYDFYDEYDDYDSPYNQIIESDNPSNVDDVSMLRHYINCHGITKKLRNYLNAMDDDTIAEVCYYCKGSVTIKSLRHDVKKVLEEEKQRRQNIEDAKLKNLELVHQLKHARKDFCGIDTRNIKLLLNRLAKKGDNVAKLLRTLLQAEDENVQAKNGWKSEWHYRQKYLLVIEACQLAESLKFKYGVQKSDNYSANAVMYFELPCTNAQISFHMKLDDKEFEKYPTYEKDWDEKVNSTIPKLEECILTVYQEEVFQMILNKQKKDSKKAEKENLIRGINKQIKNV